VLSLRPADLPTIANCFTDLPDPGKVNQGDHLHIDILFIAVCALICGADGFTGMEEFDLAKEAWLRQFLQRPNGVLSHDTFVGVLASLRPKQLQAGLLKWIESVAAVNPYDGATLKHAVDQVERKGARGFMTKKIPTRRQASKMNQRAATSG
jgi:hypothetical protein